MSERSVVIRRAVIDDLPFRKEAQAAGLRFCKTADLYVALKGGQIAGCTSVIFKSRKAIFKTHYVAPGFRRQGIFRELFEFSLRLCRLRGIQIVEAYCTAMSLPLYLANGGEVLQRFKATTRVRLRVRREAPADRQEKAQWLCNTQSQ